MAQQNELWIVLKVWDAENKGWPIHLPTSGQALTVSSLKTDATDIPVTGWEFDDRGTTPFIKWKAEGAPPERPFAVASFAATPHRNSIWIAISRVNRLTGLLVLVGTLGTAYFAYLSSTSEKETDRLTHQIQQWHDDLAPLHCSEETDAQRSVAECLSKYAKNTRELEDARRRLEAFSIAPAKCP